MRAPAMAALQFRQARANRSGSRTPEADVHVPEAYLQEPDER
jgi:hypothetical protein